MIWLLTGCHGTTLGRCAATPGHLSCEHETTTLAGRDLHWQIPEGTPPSSGWPTAWLFQGSLVPAGTFWSSVRPAPLGAHHQVELTAALLDAGYAVFTPEAAGEGLTCWNTNLPPWSSGWLDSPDAAMIEAMFDAVDRDTFGPLDPDALFAGGISSGGYMTSRLAVTYPERFAATAIASASYATCAGLVCDVPSELSSDHPPTLFLHGQLDPVVPIATMWPYHDALERAGVAVESEIAPLGAHGWSGEAPERILGWFDAAR
ncbi:MAG: PHB depolymerase family esterase [Myxococcota bacterium]